VRPRLPVLFKAVERERDSVLAEHLAACSAFRAHSTGVNDAAHADEFAFTEAVRIGAQGGDSANDLVTRHDRKVRGAPVVVHFADVAVADTAVENINNHIIRTRITALEPIWS